MAENTVSFHYNHGTQFGRRSCGTRIHLSGRILSVCVTSDVAKSTVRKTERRGSRFSGRQRHDGDMR